MDTYKSVTELDLTQAATVNSKQYKALMITSANGTSDDIQLKITTASNEEVVLDFQLNAADQHGVLILPLFVIKVFHNGGGSTFDTTNLRCYGLN